VSYLFFVRTYLPQLAAVVKTRYRLLRTQNGQSQFVETIVALVVGSFRYINDIFVVQFLDFVVEKDDSTVEDWSSLNFMESDLFSIRIPVLCEDDSYFLGHERDSQYQNMLHWESQMDTRDFDDIMHSVSEIQSSRDIEDIMHYLVDESFGLEEDTE
jgi:hypothetical protein